MKPDELRALADALSSGTHYVESPELHETMMRAADYLRACADAEPVARIYTDAEMVHRDERWGRVQWIEPESELAEDTLLYTHPAPAVPQAEPKREPLSEEPPSAEWLSTDDAETQLALAMRDAAKTSPSTDDKALLHALNRRGIWLAWIGGSDAE